MTQTPWRCLFFKTRGLKSAAGAFTSNKCKQQVSRFLYSQANHNALGVLTSAAKLRHTLYDVKQRFMLVTLWRENYFPLDSSS